MNGTAVKSVYTGALIRRGTAIGMLSLVYVNSKRFLTTTTWTGRRRTKNEMRESGGVARDVKVKTAVPDYARRLDRVRVSWKMASTKRPRRSGVGAKCLFMLSLTLGVRMLMYEIAFPLFCVFPVYSCYLDLIFHFSFVSSPRSPSAAVSTRFLFTGLYSSACRRCGCYRFAGRFRAFESFLSGRCSVHCVSVCVCGCVCVRGVSHSWSFHSHSIYRRKKFFLYDVMSVPQTHFRLFVYHLCVCVCMRVVIVRVRLLRIPF